MALLLLSAAHLVELYFWQSVPVPYLPHLVLQIPVLPWPLVGLAVQKLV